MRRHPAAHPHWPITRKYPPPPRDSEFVMWLPWVWLTDGAHRTVFFFVCLYCSVLFSFVCLFVHFCNGNFCSLAAKNIMLKNFVYFWHIVLSGNWDLILLQKINKRPPADIKKLPSPAKERKGKTFWLSRAVRNQRQKHIAGFSDKQSDYFLAITARNLHRSLYWAVSL